MIRQFRDIVNEYIFQFYATRQKLSLKGSKAPLASEATLKDVGVEDGGELCVKDLGPQISWKTVFMIEYVRSVFCTVADPMLTYFSGGTLGHTSYILSPHPIILRNRNTTQCTTKVRDAQFDDDNHHLSLYADTSTPLSC